MNYSKLAQKLTELTPLVHNANYLSRIVKKINEVVPDYARTPAIERYAAELSKEEAELLAFIKSTIKALNDEYTDKIHEVSEIKKV
jgi:hypothetical protein